MGRPDGIACDQIDFQRFAERDEAAIAERNQATVQALISFVRSRPRGVMSWDITSHLLSTGHYHSEIGSPWSDTRLHTHQVQIGQLELWSGQSFLYYFDYGDSHEFDVQLLTLNPAGALGPYPKIVGRAGQAPPQYPDYDEEMGEMEWDPYVHKF